MSSGALLVTLLAGAAAFGLALGASQYLAGGRRLKGVLESYDLDRQAPSRSRVQAARQLFSAESLRRVVRALDDTLEKRGAKQRVADELEGAGVDIAPAEFLLLVLIGVVVAILVGVLLAGVAGAFLLVILVLGGSLLFIRMRGGRRKGRFEAQIGDILALLASSLRAGLSLLQGFEAVSDQVDEPAKSELKRVVAGGRMGQSIPGALADVADKMESAEFATLATAIDVQSEIGGNLAEIIDIAADNIRERIGFRLEVKAMTSEGRTSALVLAVIPVALVIILSVIDPGYMATLYHSPGGRIALIAAAVLEIGGGFWMRRIVSIEI